MVYYLSVGGETPKEAFTRTRDLLVREVQIVGRGTKRCRFLAADYYYSYRYYPYAYGYGYGGGVGKTAEFPDRPETTDEPVS